MPYTAWKYLVSSFGLRRTWTLLFDLPTFASTTYFGQGTSRGLLLRWLMRPFFRVSSTSAFDMCLQKHKIVMTITSTSCGTHDAEFGRGEAHTGSPCDMRRAP